MLYDPINISVLSKEIAPDTNRVTQRAQYFAIALTGLREQAERIYFTAICEGVPKEIAARALPPGYKSLERLEITCENTIHSPTWKTDSEIELAQRLKQLNK